MPPGNDEDPLRAPCVLCLKKRSSEVSVVGMHPPPTEAAAGGRREEGGGRKTFDGIAPSRRSPKLPFQYHLVLSYSLSFPLFIVFPSHLVPFCSFHYPFRPSLA